MDLMKEALKRKMQSMKGEKAPLMNVEIEAGEKEKEGSDLAPQLKGPGMETEAEGMEGEEMAGMDGMDKEKLLEILAALADHESGAGRSPNGLQERAAIGAKEKLAGLKGMKK